jgi:long-chain acyl-CoA synthetase
MQEFISVLHAIASHAKTVPDENAIIEAETDRRCTYSELWAYVKAFSKRLISVGVKRDFGDGYGTRVVVRCTQTIDYLVIELAVQLSGGVFVPVEKNIAETRIIEIMKETDSKLFIASKPLSDYNCTFISITDATTEMDTSEDNNIIFIYPDSLMHILFTTGTTGNSKGVMLSQKASTARILSIYSVFNLDKKQIWLIPSPLSHCSGLRRVHISLFFQGTAVLLDGYTFAKTFISAIIKYKVTHLNLMSAAIEMYLRTCRDKLEVIHEQINGISLTGSSFSETQIKSLRDIFTKSRIIVLYGGTEVTGCYIDHASKNYAAFCIGKPRPDTEVIFFDEQKKNIIQTNRENPGLFAMSGDSKMLGYWKNPELTASVTRGEYIILSDLGYMGEDGMLYFLGRSDDVIVSGGYKISPMEIEEVANSLTSIHESACVPVSDPIMGQVPKLYVVIEENHIFNFTEIYEFLKNKLEATRVPRHIEEIDAIPRINNKINRKELKKNKTEAL